MLAGEVIVKVSVTQSPKAVPERQTVYNKKEFVNLGSKAGNFLSEKRGDGGRERDREKERERERDRERERETDRVRHIEREGEKQKENYYQ